MLVQRWLGEAFITSPAPEDHRAMINAIPDRLESSEDSLKSYQDKSRDNPDSSAQARERLQFYVDFFKMQVELWQRVRQDAIGYDIDFGYVYATSGEDDEIAKKEWQGRYDWALTSVPDEKWTQNRHIESSCFDRGSGFPLNKPARGFDKEFIHKAKKYFDPGPTFRSIRERDLEPEQDLILKPTSRTTRWAVGRLNDIQSVLSEGRSLTKEWAILALDKFQVSFAEGDSGSVMGEDGSGSIAYATPIVKVLRNIESRLGWEEGSVSLY